MRAEERRQIEIKDRAQRRARRWRREGDGVCERIFYCIFRIVLNRINVEIDFSCGRQYVRRIQSYFHFFLRCCCCETQKNTTRPLFSSRHDFVMQRLSNMFTDCECVSGSYTTISSTANVTHIRHASHQFASFHFHGSSLPLTHTLNRLSCCQIAEPIWIQTIKSNVTWEGRPYHHHFPLLHTPRSLWMLRVEHPFRLSITSPNDVNCRYYHKMKMTLTLAQRNTSNLLSICKFVYHIWHVHKWKSRHSIVLSDERRRKKNIEETHWRLFDSDLDLRKVCFSTLFLLIWKWIGLILFSSA